MKKKANTGREKKTQSLRTQTWFSLFPECQRGVQWGSDMGVNPEDDEKAVCFHDHFKFHCRGMDFQYFLRKFVIPSKSHKTSLCLQLTSTDMWCRILSRILGLIARFPTHLINSTTTLLSIGITSYDSVTLTHKKMNGDQKIYLQWSKRVQVHLRDVGWRKRSRWNYRRRRGWAAEVGWGRGEGEGEGGGGRGIGGGGYCRDWIRRLKNPWDNQRR